jgi:hypothetical protein
MVLRIAVLMKTDIVGSTPRFHAEPAGDLEALLRDHQQMNSRLSAAVTPTEPSRPGNWSLIRSH